MSGPDEPRIPASSGDENDAPLSAPEEQRWLEALRAAWAPAPLSEARHEQILNEALQDPFAEASPQEQREAEALRLALERGGEHEHAVLARALGHALGSPGPEASVPERALKKALEQPKTRSNVILVAFGVAASGLSLAASVLLVVGTAERRAPTLAREEFAPSRSLSPLLNADAARLTASERMDRVASVRARELRENRYAAWGVR